MPKTIRTLVVGVASMDDQDPCTPGDADPVLGPAVKLAATLGAQLHAVHAFEIPAELSWAFTAGQSHTSGAPGPSWTYAAELQERLERQLGAIPGGDAVHCHAVEGSAADVLCRTAEEVGAEMLVVGASRRGRQWSGILGSTASQVMAESRLPVLIVHRPFEGDIRRVLLTCDLSECGHDVLRRGRRPCGRSPAAGRSCAACTWCSSIRCSRFPCPPTRRRRWRARTCAGAWRMRGCTPRPCGRSSASATRRGRWRTRPRNGAPTCSSWGPTPGPARKSTRSAAWRRGPSAARHATCSRSRSPPSCRRHPRRPMAGTAASPFPGAPAAAA